MTPGSVWLGARSLLWLVLLPGVVAGWVPWRTFGLDRLRLDLSRPEHAAGLAAVAAGAALLVACVWEFARRGRGTLAPLDPPRDLVVRGPYRFVRNPMYLSVVTIVLGEALMAGSRALLLYGAGFAVLATLMVMGYEEPGLRGRFGASYVAYCGRVRRWLPRLRPDRRNGPTVAAASLRSRGAPE